MIMHLTFCVGESVKVGIVMWGERKVIPLIYTCNFPNEIVSVPLENYQIDQ